MTFEEYFKTLIRGKAASIWLSRDKKLIFIKEEKTWVWMDTSFSNQTDDFQSEGFQKLCDAAEYADMCTKYSVFPLKKMMSRKYVDKNGIIYSKEAIGWKIFSNQYIPEIEPLFDTNFGTRKLAAQAVFSILYPN